MSNKINIGRVILGGIVGGIVMLVIGAIIHGFILQENYMFLQEHGILRGEEDMGMMGWLHHAVVILLGIPLAALYAFSRNHFGPGPKAAMTVGLMVGLFGLGGAVAMYAYYNVGGFVPLMMAVDILLECIAGTMVVGAIYKESVKVRP